LPKAVSAQGKKLSGAAKNSFHAEMCEERLSGVETSVVPSEATGRVKDCRKRWPPTFPS
jgi:hypothetical protein